VKFLHHTDVVNPVSATQPAAVSVRSCANPPCEDTDDRQRASAKPVTALRDEAPHVACAASRRNSPEVSQMIRVATLSTLYVLSMGLLIAAYAILPMAGR